MTDLNDIGQKNGLMSYEKVIRFETFKYFFFLFIYYFVGQKYSPTF